MQPLLEDNLKNKSCELASIQSAMAKAIMRPLVNDKIQSVLEDGSPIENIAAQFIKPNSCLSSAERLEIYNQQYWIRLLDLLQEDFPGLIALLGDEQFETLTTAYLTNYPSDSFNLSELGNRLAQFILARPELTDPHTELAYQIALFEWAEVKAFDQKNWPALQTESLAGLDPMKLKLALQPYITLLELNYALDDFLIKLNKGSQKTIESNAAIKKVRTKTVKKLPKKEHIYIAIHRLDNVIYYKRLVEEQFLALMELSSGKTLGEVYIKLLEKLDCQDAQVINQTIQRIQQDFSDWMELGWFCNTSKLVVAQ